MNKTKSAAILMLGAALGAGGSMLTISNVQAADTHERFQNTHIWVATQSTATASTIYGARNCNWLVEVDGGRVSEPPCTERVLNAAEAKCFEAYLSCL